MRPLLRCKCNKYYTTGVCVFVALGIQHAMRMSHIFNCGLQYSSTLSHKWHDFRKTKVSEHKMRVLIFSTILSETFLILRRNERDMIKMHIGLHVKYPLFLSEYNQTSIFETHFRKILKYQIS